MHILRCDPADLVALLVTTKLTVPRGVYSRLLVQVMMGDAWAVYDAADPAAPLIIAGLFAWDDHRESEAWFTADTNRAAKGLPMSLLAMRQVLREQAPRHGNGILTRVAPGNRAGETIARFLGFVPAGEGLWRFAWQAPLAASSEATRHRNNRSGCLPSSKLI